MPPLRALVLTGSLALLLAPALAPAHAQEWQQEIQVITPVQFGGSTHVLLDSLAATLDRNPELQARRSPDSTAMSFGALRESLYADGIDLRSATHAFIRYRFDLTKQGSGVIETVEDLYFIVRLDETQEDLPVLYVDTRDPLVSDLLLDRGIPSVVNMKSVTSFRKLVAYPLLNDRNEIAVVEFGGRTVRDTLLPQQETLLTLINEHMSVGTYILTTSHQQMAAATL